MQRDEYVIDDKRNMAWDTPGEALKWYEQRLTELQNGLPEIMTVLTQVVRLADRRGVDISEQHWLDRAQIYIDIYQGLQTDDQ